MSVKVLVVGGPHVKMSNLPETDILTKDIIKAIDDYDPDFVVVLGDTLHRHNIVDVQAHVKATSMLEAIDAKKPLVLLIGNHDLASRSSFLSDNHPFTALKLWKQTTVVDTICTTFEYKGITFAAVPYVPPGRLFEALDTNPKWRSSRAVFIHQELLGCKMGRIYSKEGDRWSPDLPLAIAGHVYQYQRLDNAIYVGTPRQTSFNDSGDKALSLFTFNEDSFDELRIPTTVLGLVKIVTDLEDINSVVIPDKRTVKVVVKGSQSNKTLFSKSQLVASWKLRGVEVVFEDKDKANKEAIPFSDVECSDFLDILMRKISGDDVKMRLFKEATTN